MAQAHPLPGFQSPAVGFEQPFEMLHACHERVQRSLDLLARLLSHLEHHGHDAPARSAAKDVLRYFDLAAPLHHADEEQHVFPRLLIQADAEQRRSVQRLLDEHRQMEAIWAALRPWLVQCATEGSTPPVTAEVRQNVQAFTALYAGHLTCEERWAFAQAREGLSDEALAAMGRSMQTRRSGG